MARRFPSISAGTRRPIPSASATTSHAPEIRRAAIASPSGASKIPGCPTIACLLAVAGVFACGASTASAALAPSEALTYIPYGFIHNPHSAELVEETLAQLSSYGIGQALLPLPNFKKNGTFKLSRTESRMVALWATTTKAYNAAHGTDMVATVDFGGKLTRKSLDLEEPAVRENIVAAVEPVLAMGVGAVSLDLEPYPQSRGFVLLLEELDAAFTRRGFDGRLSVTAPASASRWPPAYMAEVTSHISQVDPLFYDSERKTAAAYDQWVREGLAAYSANTAPGTRIIPVLPSYGASREHDPAVENLTTSTTAVEEALVEGSRVNGAGIFWWWGFYYDEQGEGEYEGAPDRAAWLTQTLNAPSSP